MKKSLLVLMLTTFLCIGAQKPVTFFDPSKLMEVGVYYYPEAWDQSQWERDFKKIKEMGFEFVHMAEFSWAMLEPEEGRFDFTWLDKAVDLASKNGLKIMLCTPSPCPPAWLVTKYPEVLVVKDNGIRAQHGTRTHCSWSSPKFRELTSIIVTKLGERYGNDKRIWGWQLDNEPGHYGVEDYNPAARESFISWLKKKYTTLDQLNKAWGNAFWSEIYTAWEQIVIPNYQTQFAGVNPHAMLDFKRFNADECASFLSMQTSILRKLISKEQFITTNYMHDHDKVNPWLNKDLDFAAYTLYPVAGYTKGCGEQGFRMGDPWRVSFSNDRHRAIKGITGVMELQPGQVNWGSYNALPLPGAIHAWLWTAFAGDLKFACSYRFRQPIYGGEQYHYGMIGPDGVTPLYGGMEYSKFMSELKELRKSYDPKRQQPEELKKTKTAILLNYDNNWATSISKQTFQWNFDAHVQKIYAAVKSLGVSIDFIDEQTDFSKYAFIICPAYQLLDPALVDKWTKYTENGGNLVFTCRAGQMDRNGHLWEAAWAAPIHELIGARIAMYDHLPADVNGKVKMNEETYTWNNWGDILDPFLGTEVWANYNDQFYAGKPAATFIRKKTGSVMYIGPDTDEGKLEKELFVKFYSRANAPVKELPEGVIRDWRDGFWIYVNYSSKDQMIDIPEKAKILLGQRMLKPAEVLVFME